MALLKTENNNWSYVTNFYSLKQFGSRRAVTAPGTRLSDAGKIHFSDSLLENNFFASYCVWRCEFLLVHKISPLVESFRFSIRFSPEGMIGTVGANESTNDLESIGFALLRSNLVVGCLESELRRERINETRNGWKYSVNTDRKMDELRRAKQPPKKRNEKKRENGRAKWWELRIGSSQHYAGCRLAGMVFGMVAARFYSSLAAFLVSLSLPWLANCLLQCRETINHLEVAFSRPTAKKECEPELAAEMWLYTHLFRPLIPKLAPIYPLSIHPSVY